MKIDYSDWWNDVVAILRSNASILAAVAGVFIFLPALIGDFAFSWASTVQDGATWPELVAAYSELIRANWLPFVVIWFVNTLGQVVLFAVLLDGRRPRVGEAFGVALPLFLPFLLVQILSSVAVGFATLLLIIPGLYLFGRLLLAPPIVVAERRANPLAAIARSWALTQGQGWRIFFFVFLILIVAFVIQAALLGTLGLVFSLLGSADNPYSIGKLLISLLQALVTAVASILSSVILVALYRRLTLDPGKTFT